jgi:hypothetical protein
MRKEIVMQRRPFREHWAKLLRPAHRRSPVRERRDQGPCHTNSRVAVDFFTVPTARLRVLFVLVVPRTPGLPRDAGARSMSARPGAHGIFGAVTPYPLAPPPSR